jgi:hypothetical protein
MKHQRISLDGELIRTPLLTVLLVCFALLCHLVIGIRLESSGVMGTVWLSGRLFGEPYTEYYMKDFCLLGDFVGMLYRWQPSVAWFTWFILCCNAASSSIILIRLWVIGRSNGLSIGQLSLPLFTLMFLLSLNQLALDHSRCAFLLCLAGVILIATPTKLSVGKLAFASVLFASGTFMRSETALGTILLSAPGILLVMNWSWRVVLRRFAPLLLIAATYSAVFVWKLNFDDRFYYQVEPDFEYELMDRSHIVPLSSMPNYLDSMRYKAIAHHWMLADSVQTPPSFIRSLIDKPSSVGSRFVMLPSAKTMLKAAGHVRKIAETPSAWLLIACLLCIFPWQNRHIGSAWHLPLLLLHGLMVLLVIIGNVSSELPSRFIDPVMAVTATMCCLSAFSGDQKQRTSPVQIGRMDIARILVVVVASVLAGRHEAQLGQSYRELIAANVLFREQVDVQGLSYAIVNLDTDILIDDPFATAPIFARTTVIPIDLVQYSYTAQNKRNLSRITGCSPPSFECVLRFIASEKHRVLAVGDIGRIDFYRHYASEVYGISYDLEPIGWPHPNGRDQLHLLR